MEHLTLRPAGMADASAIACLMEQLGYPTEAVEMEARLTGILPHSDYHTLVAELNSRIVGMIGLHLGRYYEKNGVYGHIVALLVEPEHQGQHIGSSLVREGGALAKDARSPDGHCE
jgi:predicted N-acetyltransferase YhbS